MAKLSKKLPSRVTNEKAKAKRQRSYSKRQAIKLINIAENDGQRIHNVSRGYTGKQFDNAIRRYSKMHGYDYRGIRSETIGHAENTAYIVTEMRLI